MNSSFYHSVIVFPDGSIISFLSVKVYQLRLEIRQQALTFTLISVALAIYSQIISCVHKVPEMMPMPFRKSSGYMQKNAVQIN